MKTKKMKTVLIAVDFNPTAQKVAEEGYSLASSLGAEVVLLHVMVNPLFYSTIDNYPLTDYSGALISALPLPETDRVQKEAHQFLDKLKLELGGSNIQTLVKEGDSADTILQTATDLKADLIVLGSHSRRWLDDVLMGSVAKEVLHHSTTPLFIIPTHKTKDTKKESFNNNALHPEFFL
jgi:nucleotide-binding universal stress UspA family protein